METTALPKPAKPDEHLTITHKGQSRELFFSFTRQNMLLKHFPEPTNAFEAMIDPHMADTVLAILLVENPKHIDSFELEEKDVSNADIEKVLNWAAEHLIYFFVSKFQQIAEKATALEPLMQALEAHRSFTAGSTGSTSTSPVAGPSA